MSIRFNFTAEVILDKVYHTTRLIKMFDTCPDDGHKRYFLNRIKKNIEDIDKKIEKLGGLDRTLEQMGSYQSDWEEDYNNIKSFMETKDLSDDEEEARKARRKPKPVTATELNTNNVKEYKSIHAAHKDLGINPGQIKMCCEGTNNVKTGLSKKDGKRYEFHYASH